MANINIFSGTATFDVTKNPTPFGFYNADDQFQKDAPAVAMWCAQRLGYPIVDIELQQENFFAAFEEAVTEYGTQVYQFEVINNIGNLLGYPTKSIDDVIDPETGELIPGEGLNNINVSNVYGASDNDTSPQNEASYGLSDSKFYSASLDVKSGIQKYDLLSSSPEYATATLTFGPWSGPLNHSESIVLTDTKGSKVHYRATTGLSNGGWNGAPTDGIPTDPREPDKPNMATGSGEYRQYRHLSSSVGEFATGSYVGVSPGLGVGITGSAANSDLSASFDSFIKTLTSKQGVHRNSFTVSSSHNGESPPTIYYAHITQKAEGSGGNTTITSSLTGVTVPDAFVGGDSGLNFEVSGSQILAKSLRINIEKVYHYQPAAINRYFDPYAGTGTGIQSLMQTFGFGNYSPGVNFMLMPMYFDALKLQAIEMNDKIRKSAYHFELSGKNLRLFPIPTRDFRLWFDYSIADSEADLTTGAGHSGGDVEDDEDYPTDKITNQMNVPFKEPTYRFINAIGKQWIRKYSLALSKEMLGSIRGKYQALPIPGSETTLDYSRLLSEAAAEKEALVTQLREDLDQTTTLSQNERGAAESAAQQDELQTNNPYQIYIH